MTEAEIALNRAHWDEVVPVHVASPFYEVDALRRGEVVLDRLAQEAVGEIKGKRLLHLQCHFGVGTLSLARLGAEVTGLDFSEPALELARTLSRELDVPATFIHSNVLEAPTSLEGFDVVFATWGVITWIGDLAGWMRVAARCLKPGGRLVLLDGHPTTLMLDDKLAADGPYVLRYPYDSAHAIYFDDGEDYADPAAKLQNTRTVQWMHGIGRILTAALDAGLSIRRFAEMDRIPWVFMPQMVPVEKGYWGLPPGAPQFPLSFSLMAVKG